MQKHVNYENTNKSSVGINVDPDIHTHDMAYTDEEVVQFFGISLYDKSEPVEFGDHAQCIIDDLMRAAYRYGSRCVGLAAPQIGYNKRVFIVRIDDAFVPFVNPDIIQKLGGFKSMNEGCLSFPEKRVKVRRHKKIKIITHSATGEVFSEIFTGMTARIIQHEYDHLNGVCI